MNRSKKKPATGCEPEAGLNECHNTICDTPEILTDSQEIVEFERLCRLAEKLGCTLTKTKAGNYMLKRGHHSIHSAFLHNVARHLAANN